MDLKNRKLFKYKTFWQNMCHSLRPFSVDLQGSLIGSTPTSVNMRLRICFFMRCILFIITLLYFHSLKQIILEQNLIMFLYVLIFDFQGSTHTSKNKRFHEPFQMYVSIASY